MIKLRVNKFINCSIYILLFSMKIYAMENASTFSFSDKQSGWKEGTDELVLLICPCYFDNQNLNSKISRISLYKKVDSVKLLIAIDDSNYADELKAELDTLNSLYEAGFESEYSPSIKKLILNINLNQKDLFFSFLDSLNEKGIEKIKEKIGEFLEKTSLPALSTNSQSNAAAIYPSSEVLIATSEGGVCMISNWEKRTGQVLEHPFFGNVKLPVAHKRDFITGFDPINQSLPNETDSYELAEIFHPSDPLIPYNAEQLITAGLYWSHYDNSEDNAINLNSDLGLQFTLREILRKEVLASVGLDGEERPNFIILSHGHPLAGLAELAKMTTTSKDGSKKYLFDTSIFFPQGQWTAKKLRLGVVIDSARIWAKSIRDIKTRYRTEELHSAGGIAIGLNGHRGDPDWHSGKKATANIDVEAMLGEPEKFKQFLKNRGLRKIVIITEHYVKDPTKVNYLSLEDLRYTEDTFDRANSDLYEYMNNLRNLGIEIIVVSGEQRAE